MSKYTEFRDWLDYHDEPMRNWLSRIEHPARVGVVTVVVLLIVGLILLIA